MPEIAVLGEGLLVESIVAALSGSGSSVSPLLTSGAVAAVVAHDRWDLSGYAEVRAAAAAAGVPWLPVRAELGRVVLGPLEESGLPGCVDCGEFRRRLAHLQPDGHETVWREQGATLSALPSAWLTGLSADLAATLVVAEIARLANRETARTRSAFVYVDLETLAVEPHPFLPDPLCDTCGTLPPDDRSRADISLRSRPKPAPDVYRLRSMTGEVDTLKARYVDGESGLIRSVLKSTEGGIVVAAAPMGLRQGSTEYGFGRTRNYQGSQVTAMLETLERHGGMEPGGKRTTVSASYAEIGRDAIDPRTLGLYPAERHRIPGFPYRPFDEEQVCRWVWGYSFARCAPVLVPETYAYYRARHHDAGRPPFVQEVSNGCALGGSLEEAVFHGILEVAERDAFMMTWYARMPVPRIDVTAARDSMIPLIIEAIEAETGYQVMLFDTTLEQGIPCVWAMAVDPGDDEKRPKAACSAGAHPVPERAIENALNELGPLLADLIKRYPDHVDETGRMVDDSSLVKEMEDHRLLYGDHRTYDRLRFLTQTPRRRHIDDLPVPPGLRNADLRDDLIELVNRYLGTGLDVIVVDQTTPEHEVSELACVKVVIPGTLPVTFGHDYRRVDGLPRLYEVPYRLGYRDRPLEPQDVNPHPHAFP
ncbi:TOMM precursor leader peptide-binding protein [Nonomuraea aurantiaca]|uniref:TOMM precursor leader peptide-binding protein n=1 Tax=Nonomuraea aurantiaca TaxID=2878562 RepID=UPI001CD9C9B1|nr:TOMM precursor leader peptide-binding protein [Nonomuraea aurantiaca]MCA2225173.1 TOMM precursor leader peptide-binding protein [Nonomuraea aurantiaca]